uniref:Hypothetical PepH protein n=2 Tax=Acidianus ambivalens TaxID=2283 RepID=O57697_ACIAM|nr:hypothetical PepH protein [Acidianus ambivalens]
MSKRLKDLIPPPQTNEETKYKYSYEDFKNAFGDFANFDTLSHLRVMQYLKQAQTREEQDIFTLIQRVLALQKELKTPGNEEKESAEAIKTLNFVLDVIKQLNDPRVIDLVKRIVDALATRAAAAGGGNK